MQEAGELAKNTSILMNVSEFDDVSKATDTLISSLQAFKKEGQDVGTFSMEIIDKYNEIGNNYAISTSDLADSLTRSSAALVAANNSLEQSIAMTAAANTTIQDPESVGNALKTVSMRIRGVKTELEEAGEDTEGMVTNTAKLQEKIMALTNIDGKGGINILTESGDFKSTYDILLGISKVWKEMDDTSQAALLEIVAGKTRGSVVASLFQNGDILEQAYDSAINASGSAMEELNNHLSSIQGHIDIFNNSLQTMWMNFINTDAVKWVVHLGTALVKLVDTIGLIPSAAGAFATFKFAANDLKGIFDSTSVSTKQVRKELHEYLATQKDSVNVSRTVATAKQQEAAATNVAEQAQAKETAGSITNAGANIKQAEASNQVQKEKLEEAAATNKATQEDMEETAGSISRVVSGVGSGLSSMGSALGKVGTVIMTLGKSLVKAFGVLIAVDIATKIFGAVYQAIDDAHKTTEELVDEWDNLKTELENINGELEDTQARIKELENQGTLSFTDKKELELLRQQNDELERRLRITQSEGNTAAAAARASVKSDYEKEFIKGAVVTEENQNRYNHVNNVIGAIGAIDSMYDTALGGLSDEYKRVIKSVVSDDIYNELATNSWDAVSENSKNVIQQVYGTYQQELTELQKYTSSGTSVFGDVYIDQAIQKIKEYKEELYDINGQLKTGLNDQYVVDVNANIDNLETGLLEAANELYTYLDNYSGDANDPFVKHLEEQIEKIDMTVNPIEFYSKKFDEIFGKYSDEKRTLYELAQAGKLTAQTLNGIQYDPLMHEMRELGVTAQDVVDHITSLSESDLSKVTDPIFNISDYAAGIDVIQENISEYQSALASLEEGTFTYSDFIDLTQKFPDLAKGVDTSSKKFTGLTKNLKKAIKTSPEDLIDDLKSLRKQLQSTGKSTADIDQLIDSLENLPVETITNLSNEYHTLTDEINAAKKAQSEMQEAMGKNPNEGYETRADAMEYMKDKMSRGEIGSESELWDVAEKYGFTYDSAQTINENADALAKFIAIREKWFAENEDGEQTFEGTESFIEAVEAAVNNSEELQSLINTWNYDETTGVFDVDFDNENWDDIVEALSKTKELAGLTSDEFADMMVQIGQYFGINWGNYKDAYDHLTEISNGASDAETKVEEYGQEMQSLFGKGDVDLTTRPEIAFDETNFSSWAAYYQKIIDESENYTQEYVEWAKKELASIKAGDTTATVYSSTYYKSDFSELEDGESNTAVVLTPILPDGTVLSPEQLETYAQKLLNGEEIDVEGITLGIFNNDKELKGFEEYLHKVQEEYFKLYNEYKTNPLSINVDGDIESDIINPLKNAGLAVDETIDAFGNKQFTFDVVDFESLLRNKGYTTENITAIINRLFGEGSEQSALVQAREYILNLSSITGHTVQQLKDLGLESATLSANSQGAKIYLDSSEVDEALKKYQFTDTEIETIKAKWAASGIDIRTKEDTTGIDNTETALNELPESVETKITANDTEFQSTMQSALNTLNDFVRARTATITVNTVTGEVINSSTDKTPSLAANSNLHQTHQALASGSSGINNTDTALMGELGTEMIVDPSTNTWRTVGENGAEFTQVKRGQIVFNHKQTEQLLKNGHTASRGKINGGMAFASGTAYLDGGGQHAYYDFSGSGGYQKYDVNDNLLDSFGDLSWAASDAAESLSDAADEFRETFDWIEVRLEEINEKLSLKSAQLENAIGSSNQNAIIDDMIAINQKLYDNLIAGANKYYDHAQKLLEKVPEAYRSAAQDGTIAIEDFVGEVDEKTLESIQNYREWVQKGADVTQQAEEVRTEIRSLAKQQFDNVAQEYDNKTSFHDSKIDQLEAHNSLLETDKGFASENIYQAIIDNIQGTDTEVGKIDLLEQKRADLKAELAGIEVGTQDWYDAVNAIMAVDTEIINLNTDVKDTQDSINELHWEKFELLMTQFEAVANEADNLLDILGTKDAVDELGEWTDEGITSLGLYAQKMEVAEMQAKQYKEEIEYLNTNWKELGYTQEEYVEKLEELKDGQYGAIQSYNDSKEAIVDLNKERIDAIKTIIEDEVSAYEELIEAKKKALDADKD